MVPSSYEILGHFRQRVQHPLPSIQPVTGILWQTWPRLLLDLPGIGATIADPFFVTLPLRSLTIFRHDAHVIADGHTLYLYVVNVVRTL